MRLSRDVIPELFQRMERTVAAYSADAVKVSGYIDGTAFFPGGSGLWRGLTRHGPLPEHFPDAPVMFLGHNFDSVQGHANSVERGIEHMGHGTWKYILLYLEEAGLTPDQCFFTNVFVGLQPLKAEGKMNGSDVYERQCRSFLVQQIELVKPRLIAALGVPAREQLEIIRPCVRCVNLLHPGNLRFKKKEMHEALMREQGALVAGALTSKLSTLAPENADSLRE